MHQFNQQPQSCTAAPLSYLPSFGASAVRICGSSRLVHGQNLSAGKQESLSRGRALTRGCEQPRVTWITLAAAHAFFVGRAKIRLRLPEVVQCSPIRTFLNSESLGFGFGVPSFDLLTHSQDFPRSPAHADRAPRSCATIAQAQKRQRRRRRRQGGGGTVTECNGLLSSEVPSAGKCNFLFTLYSIIGSKQKSCFGMLSFVVLHVEAINSSQLIPLCFCWAHFLPLTSVRSK